MREEEEEGEKRGRKRGGVKGRRGEERKGKKDTHTHINLVSQA